MRIPDESGSLTSKSPQKNETLATSGKITLTGKLDT
jgi:hypothetical protein